MSMCRVFSCVVGRGCLLWPVHSFGRTLLAFALLHFVLQGQICLLLQVSWLPTFAFQSPVMKWQNVVHWRREWQTTSVFLPWVPRNSMKRPKDRTLKDKLPRLVCAQYTTGDQWRNNYRKNEGIEPKQKQHSVVDGTSHRSKVWCCKEQYCIGSWNVRSMNQGKLEVVKQEMARVNINILGISELDWNGWMQLRGPLYLLLRAGIP